MQSKLGPFHILEIVGRGGMGTVYRGLDPIIGRPVAVKVIRLLGYNDKEEQSWLRDRLFREARAAGSLCHPGIVTIYQVGEDQDVAYIAMEFVDGASLQQILERGECSNKRVLCNILVEAAEALDYAHDRGLIHRDIKPANIMVTAGGVTKVTDFGIAKTMLGQTATKTGMIIGTPYYMSPEQIRGKALDGRSDQFALAVVAYEIFAGRKPFQAEQPTSVCYQIIHEEPLSPENINPDVGSDLAAVIKKGLAKEVENRFTTCAAFATALRDAFLRTCEIPPAKETIKAAPPLLPTPRKSLAATPLLGLAACVGAMLCVGWAWGLHKAPATPVQVETSASPIHPPSASPASSRPINTPPPSPVVLSSPLPAAPVSPSPQAPIVERKAAPNVEPKVTANVLRREQLLPPPPNAVTVPTREIEELPRARPPKSRTGMLIWTGQGARGELLTITGARASAGLLSGALPSGPARLIIYPAKTTPSGIVAFSSDPRHAQVAAAPVTPGSTGFIFDPRHATDLTVYESPGPHNDWKRLVIRINAAVSACVIEWLEN